MVPPRTYSHIGAAVVVAGTLAADPVQRRMPSGARSPDDRTLAQACRATAAVSLGTSPHARAPTGRRSDGSRPASSFDVPSSELIYVEDLRQEEVPDDHEGDQTEGNDHTSESVAWPDHHPNDRRRAQAEARASDTARRRARSHHGYEGSWLEPYRERWGLLAEDRRLEQGIEE
jgi:hypothetical protein